MASINYTLSTKSSLNNEKEILIRFTHGRINQRGKTSIFILSEYWDAEKQQIIIPNFRIQTTERRELKKNISEQSEKLNKLTNHILKSFNSTNKNDISKDWLKNFIKEFYCPQKNKLEYSIRLSFFEIFDNFIMKRDLSDARKKHYFVLKRVLQRYEIFINQTEDKIFKLDLNTLNLEIIENFESFLRNEHHLYESHKEVYELFPIEIGGGKKTRIPKPRGVNRINGLFKMFRSFVNWCIDNGITANKTFKRYRSKPDVYGTPFYITIDERNHLYNMDLNSRPQLAIQKDIFIFQCLIGCRVSDLYKLTKNNIIQGAIEYIPQKTKEGRPITVRVPLNTLAQEIILKYKTENTSDSNLFPYISEQKYNDAIKTMFTLAGLTRPVTIINSVTSEPEVRALNEIASSHLARRTFVGNLYKQVKDPSLVGSLSGHKEGSKAFARYRDIDEDMKKDLVKLLE